MGARGVAMARAGVISGARVDDGGSLAGPWRVVWRTLAGRWVDVLGRFWMPNCCECIAGLRDVLWRAGVRGAPVGGRRRMPTHVSGFFWWTSAYKGVGARRSPRYPLSCFASASAFSIVAVPPRWAPPLSCIASASAFSIVTVPHPSTP